MPDHNYYGNINSELLHWIPLTARRILELGCGEGALAAAYKMRNPQAEYVAVETHGPSAAVARSRVDRLIEADFMALPQDELEALGRFDAIVLGDVLEHLSDPWRVLRALRGMLTDDGRLALSVPNVSHWTAQANLMMGQWPSMDSGLFDRTHIRFFTLKSLSATLADCGFAVERSRPRIFVLDKAAAERWIPILASAAEQAGQGKTAFVERAQTLQYVATARDVDQRPTERLHVHFAAMSPDFLDVRMRLPAEALQSDPTLTVSYRERSAALPNLPVDRPKVAVLQRLIMKEDAHWRTFVSTARAQGWTLVYEIDDHPDLVGRVHQGGTMSAQICSAIQYCHAVQTSTPKLAEVVRRLNPEAAVFQNALIDLPAFRPKEAVRRIFYGALNREGFSAKVAAALAPAIEAHPELEFVVLHDKAFFNALPTERKSFKSASPYAAYLEAMASCDVILSPLEGAEGELYKSDIKFLEAARCGVAMIASPCVYEETIQHGVTGLIAPDLPDWARCLSALVDDPALRNSLAEAAWREVRDNRLLSAQIPARRDWYRDIYQRRAMLDQALLQRRPDLQEPETL